MIRRQRSAHAAIWTILAIFLPIVLLIALAAGASSPPERPPVRLDVPDAKEASS